MKNSIEYLDKIVNILEKPYFYEMRNYGIIDDKEHKYVLSKIYGDEIVILYNYNCTDIYDFNRNKIYYEDSKSYFWYKQEYDSNRKVIYYENCDGYWYKREYEFDNAKQIYYENSEGEIIDER